MGERQPHRCSSTGKEAKTSSGRRREDFSEEVAVDGTFQMRRMEQNRKKWKKESDHLMAQSSLETS